VPSVVVVVYQGPRALTFEDIWTKDAPSASSRRQKISGKEKRKISEKEDCISEKEDYIKDEQGRAGACGRGGVSGLAPNHGQVKKIKKK
jgi:hypothetical protein